jgi:tetratricopeptide (TPR) repeat protein
MQPRHESKFRLNSNYNYPQLAIDISTFSRALEGGALDACLAYLQKSEITGPAAARLACHLGEKLFYCGRSTEASECARWAFAAAANDKDIIYFCAWLFSNCGCFAEAACAYQRLLEHRPDWIEGYRHASGALAAIGADAQAISFATKASDLAPENFDFACHAGCLLLDAGRAEDATPYLNRAVTIEPRNPQVLRALSAASHALDQPDEALEFALQAVALAPRDNSLATHAAELLLRRERIDEAATLLVAAVARDPTNATLWRMVSAAESQRDAIPAALTAIDRALGFAPDNDEYHLHRGHLLYRSGDFAAAAEAVNRAAALDPASQAAQRARVDLLLATGQLSEATAVGGELLRAFPDDEASAEAVLRVLNRRLDTIDGDYVVLGDRNRRLSRPRRRPPSFVERLKTQVRVIHALIIRETRTRFGGSRLGYGWALIEPVLHIALLWVMFSLLMHGTPPIGTHFFLFYYTGLIRPSGANRTNRLENRKFCEFVQGV